MRTRRRHRIAAQHRVLTLEGNGYIERHPSQVGYRLAIKLWSLGCIAARRVNVSEIARPHLEELAHKTGEMTEVDRPMAAMSSMSTSSTARAPCAPRARNEAQAPIRIILPAHRLAAAKASTMGGLIRTAAAEISRKLGHDGRGQPRPTKRAG